MWKRILTALFYTGYILKWMFWCMILSTSALTESNECMRNNDIGNREGNTYSCDDPEFPECCEIDKEFMCCEDPTIKNRREGLVLLSVLGGIIILLIVIVVCIHKDMVILKHSTLKESWKACASCILQRKPKKLGRKNCSQGKQLPRKSKLDGFGKETGLELERKDTRVAANNGSNNFIEEQSSL